MIDWVFLVIPSIFAVLHRLNGEDVIPKWMYFSFAFTFAAFVFSPAHWFAIAAFMLFFAAQIVPPTHPLFSAGHGRVPGRKDSWKWQWMRRPAALIAKKFDGQTPEEFLTSFGVIYGAIRAILTLPAIFLLCGYAGSWIPLTGLLFMGTGLIYYGAGALQRHYKLPEPIFVFFAEIPLGWMIGTYLLIVKAALS